MQRKKVSLSLASDVAQLDTDTLNRLSIEHGLTCTTGAEDQKTMLTHDMAAEALVYATDGSPLRISLLTWGIDQLQRTPWTESTITETTAPKIAGGQLK